MRTLRRPFVLVVTLAVIAGALAGIAPAGAADAGARAKAPAVTDPATFTAAGSINQAYVENAAPGTSLVLVDAKNNVLASGKADKLGSLIFRKVKAADGYTVRSKSGSSVYGTEPFEVLSVKDTPPQSFYDTTKLQSGLNYVKVRDGIELAMTVRLPAGKTLADGPFPTFIEYSGYQIAAPHDLLASVVGSLSGNQTATDPLAPATSTAVGSVIGPLLGYAVVSVQMRGSGCSGGAFDLFDLPTTYDGYDAVETVAAQPWVKGGTVGMAGISFSGITQLFTAGTRPPHLSAIAPMSVTDDIYTATGYPGGIFNKGFALSWIQERIDDSKPAPEGGQPYAKALVAAGDQHCIANQKLRLQTLDALQIVKDNPYRTPSLFDPRSPGLWMKKITVPTFLVGQFQDEQTGGHFPESFANLDKNKKVWISVQNGVHADSLGPSTMSRWVEFLGLYVGNQIPEIPPTVLSLGGALYQFLADANSAPIQQTRFAGTTDVAAAKKVFEADPRVRILMDNGAGPEGPGSIGATWELDYDNWPVKQAKAATYWFGSGGSLTTTKPGSTGTVSYVADPSARPAQTLPGDGQADAWKAQPPYDWTPVADDKGLGFTSAALKKDVVVAGTGSVDVYVKSTAKDTDLQVTITEVRPDGNETYVQNGWLRASHRKLDAAKSTALDPVPTHLKKDAAPLPKGKYSLVRVPIFPVAHAFRAGSKIRITITAPGGDRPRWDFETVDDGSATNTIIIGGSKGAKVVLPVVVGATAKGTRLPTPTALRGEPNRTYETAGNGG